MPVLEEPHVRFHRPHEGSSAVGSFMLVVLIAVASVTAFPKLGDAAASLTVGQVTAETTSPTVGSTSAAGLWRTASSWLRKVSQTQGESSVAAKQPEPATLPAHTLEPVEPQKYNGMHRIAQSAYDTPYQLSDRRLASQIVAEHNGKSERLHDEGAMRAAIDAGVRKQFGEGQSAAELGQMLRALLDEIGFERFALVLQYFARGSHEKTPDAAMIRNFSPTRELWNVFWGNDLPLFRAVTYAARGEVVLSDVYFNSTYARRKSASHGAYRSELRSTYMNFRDRFDPRVEGVDPERLSILKPESLAITKERDLAFRQRVLELRTEQSWPVGSDALELSEAIGAAARGEFGRSTGTELFASALVDFADTIGEARFQALLRGEGAKVNDRLLYDALRYAALGETTNVPSRMGRNAAVAQYDLKLARNLSQRSAELHGAVDPALIDRLELVVEVFSTPYDVSFQRYNSERGPMWALPSISATRVRSVFANETPYGLDLFVPQRVYASDPR